MARFLLVLLLLGIATPLLAQTVTLDPNRIDFIASADHNATNLAGAPVVASYELGWIAQNVIGAVAFTKGLGKPTPDAFNHIVVTIPEFLTLQTETVFVAKVTAVGSGGLTGVSAPSNPFGRPGPPRQPAAPGSVVVKP